MNKKPVSYLQTDPRWKNKPYRVKGENSTIGGSGCGPTAAAMLIETITGKKFTPEDACKWSIDHGYKALNQGTYYAYFEPQFKAFGIDCKMLNWTNTYGKPDHANHEAVVKKLKEGYYAIALMNKGLWTSNGHFVVVWWQDGKVRINDPASTKDARVNGDIRTFRSQVKYYWLVDARKFNAAEPPKPATPKPKPESQIKIAPAFSFSNNMAGTYQVTASGLNVRQSPVVGKVLKVLPKGTKVTCYGYYTVRNGVTWLLAVAPDGTTGHLSKQYLKKV